jgi:hypothetical protein
LKRVLVVVHDEKEFFEGTNLEVINRPAQVDIASTRIIGPELLIVKDGKQELAVFQEWAYWKKVE